MLYSHTITNLHTDRDTEMYACSHGNVTYMYINCSTRAHMYHSLPTNRQLNTNSTLHHAFLLALILLAKF